MDEKPALNPRPTPANCPLHPSMMTRRVCDRCNRPICVHCDALSKMAGLCPTCAREEIDPSRSVWRDDRARMALIAVCMMIFILAYIFPYEQSGPKRSTQKPSESEEQIVPRRPLSEFSTDLVVFQAAAVWDSCEALKTTPDTFLRSADSNWPEVSKKPPMERSQPPVDLSSAIAVSENTNRKSRIEERADLPAGKPPAHTSAPSTEVKTTADAPAPSSSASAAKPLEQVNRSVPPNSGKEKQIRRHFLGNDPLAKYHMDAIPSDSRCIILTFDGNFMDNCVDPILDILADKNVKGNFFLTGFFITHFPQKTKSILARGHEIGNHTWSHPRLTTYDTNRTHATRAQVSRAFISRQLRRTAQAFTELTGEDLYPFWRAPFGEHNRQIRTWAYAEGFLHIGWSSGMDSIDWLDNPESRFYWRPDDLKHRLLAKLDGSDRLTSKIVLFHLGSHRPDADRPIHMLAAFIDEARQRGFRFTTVSQTLQSSQRIQTTSKAATGSDSPGDMPANSIGK